MSTLARLQHDLQQHVLKGDAAILAAVNGSERVPAATRLAVYAEAYRLRLIEALASNMPRLQQLLGQQEFPVVAQMYIDRHPSTFTSIRWFGHRLGELLAQERPAEPWLAELARWEWAIAAAFDAPDGEPMGFTHLAQFAPDDWPALAFQFHASVQSLQAATNAPALFKALTEEQPAPQPANLDEPQAWLIWRRELTTQYRSMDPAEAATLAVMREGGTFASMCETLCAWHDPEQVATQAATYLKQWITEDLIIEVQRTDA